MALADIVQRIERDAVTEAFDVTSQAQEFADERVTDARERAELARTLTLAKAERDAHAEAETLLATARLESRDRQLAARRALVDRVLLRARDAVVALPDDTYVDLVARRIVAAARGGEEVVVASADAHRLADALPDAVTRVAGRDLGLVWPSEPAPVEHGAVLRGDRVSVDLSIDAAIDERRDELAMLAAEILFGTAGD
jgi:vacuolar-type H+-ATPase subunit E/Vma4